VKTLTPYVTSIARIVWRRQNAMMSSKTQIQTVQENSSRALIFYLLCLGFVLNGIIISFIGPLLPVFARNGDSMTAAPVFSPQSNSLFRDRGAAFQSPYLEKRI